MQSSIYLWAQISQERILFCNNYGKVISSEYRYSALKLNLVYWESKKYYCYSSLGSHLNLKLIYRVVHEHNLLFGSMTLDCVLFKHFKYQSNLLWHNAIKWMLHNWISVVLTFLNCRVDNFSGIEKWSNFCLLDHT